MENFEYICKNILQSLHKEYNTNIVTNIKLTLQFLLEENVNSTNYIMLGIITEIIADKFNISIDFDWNIIEYSLLTLNSDEIFNQLSEKFKKIDDILYLLDTKSTKYIKINSFINVIYEVGNIEYLNFKIKCIQMTSCIKILDKFYDDLRNYS